MQLAQVRHARVGGEVRLAVDEPLQLALAPRRSGRARRSASTSDGNGRRPRRRASRARAPGERAAEVVARERERRRAPTSASASSGSRAQDAAQQRLGARVEARRRRSRAPSGGTRRQRRRAGAAAAGRARTAACRRRSRRGRVGRGQPARAPPRTEPIGCRRPRRRTRGARGVAASDNTRERDEKARPAASATRRRGVFTRKVMGWSGGARAGPRSVRPRLVPRGLRPAAAGPARAPAPSAWSARSARPWAAPRTGTLDRNGLSFSSTPSPSGSCLPPSEGFSSAPARRAARCRRRRRRAGGRSGSRRGRRRSRRSGSASALGATPRLSFSVSAGGRVRPDLRQARDAGQQRLDDVRAVRLLDAQLEQRVEQPRGLRVERVRRRSSSGRSPGDVRLNLSFWPSGMIDLVDQRVAEPRDLHPPLAGGRCRARAR